MSEVSPASPATAPTALESALIFTFAAHVAAMLTMVAFLLPGIPGGTASGAAGRVRYVACHPWLWRAGWLGWQVTALSDLLLAIGLLCTRWVSKPAAAITVLLTLAAMCPDQIGQAVWTWTGPKLAASDPSQYLALETKLFRCITGWGGGGYLLAAFGWTWCFAAAGVWSRRMTILSIATWGLFAVSVAITFLPASIHDRPGVSKAVSGVNAVAFVLLLGWIADAWRLTRRRSR
jgi:hypothetical protein